ncbi:hypothetical protein CYLTODRAFT_426808 [Cylindrobasidium torrendii FP15055 ss-10]|uniref:GST N-terminal domain-containing protein n=1 Tax=Cylindrobasidium torrendii FP15055 ss-10 TaxID=1314674 RepID=A0A0D7AW04_9AGAR|nr:hypothetical protein CYLTODRAFT_426808 [Cylindrobasidium torrendii FP15055 ss-10]
MPEQITLYSAKICPYAQRAEIALAEVGADFKRYEIDLSNKPEWYAPKVNPASKVPAIAYGGPDVAPDQPSPESTKIPESLVLLQLIPELYPGKSSLIPKDPIVLAQARLFIETFSNTFSPAWVAFIFKGEEGAEEKLRSAIETVIKAKTHKYAVSDEFTIADAAVVPFLARLELLLTTDTGKFAPGQGSKFIASLKADASFNSFFEYLNLLKERESFKQTWHPDEVLAHFRKRLAELNAQK